ncbi:MAG: hypothetical protein KBE04_07555 [Phycisphaerae bacterium]|nr:hypothetical protein [Phycisphaerae bacterium]
METLKALRDYFPTAVYTGKCLVFISEDWRVELTEHRDNDYSRSSDDPSVIRIKISKRALDGELISGHYEDFRLAVLGELAEQIEKYVQMAIGANLREGV